MFLWLINLLDIYWIFSITTLILFILFVFVKLKFFNFNWFKTVDFTKLLKNSLHFRGWIENVSFTPLFWLIIIIMIHINLLSIWLNIRKCYIYLWMFQFIVLIERPFRSIWFSTCANATFVKSINLMCISPESLWLLISLKRTITFFILNNSEQLTSYLLNLYFKWLFYSLSYLTCWVKTILAKNSRQYSW